MFLFVCAVAVVLLVSFMCSIFESVLLSLTRPQIEVLSRDGKRSGELLKRFKENMDEPIAAILILNTAAHTIGASVAGASYSDVFSPSTLWIFSIVFTLAVLLFTEIIPKTMGVTHATTLAAPVAHGIAWLATLLRPLVAMSERMSRSLRGEREIPITSVEEIRLLASLGRNAGVVGGRTAGIIVGATQLRGLQARDVMLHREEVQFLHPQMTRDDAVAFMRKTGHSRFPFSPSGDLGDVAGVVLAKELLHWLLTHDGDTIDWDAVTQVPLVIPEHVPVTQMLRTYQETQRHLAIVVDEYGGVEGIATMEDVLEEIVGDIRDESDAPFDDFRDDGDGALVARARVDLRRLSAKLGTEWLSEHDVTTIGGLVTERLERIPKIGDRIVWQGFVVEVLQADRRRARLVRISPDSGDEDDPGHGNGDADAHADAHANANADRDLDGDGDASNSQGNDANAVKTAQDRAPDGKHNP